MSTHAPFVQQAPAKRTDNVNDTDTVNDTVNDSVNDNNNNNVDVVVDAAFAEFVKGYQDNVQTPIPPMSLEWFRHDYDEFGADMMAYAIEQAVKNSARGYGYIQSIASTWRARQIKTLSDARADDDNYRQQRAPHQHGLCIGKEFGNERNANNRIQEPAGSDHRANRDRV